MTDENGVRFLLDDDNKAANFVYRPLNDGPPIALKATLGVKFAQRRLILDDWYIFGGTKWSRMLFRLKHPIVYSKRGLYKLYRRIRRIFIKDRIVQCREWKSKEEMLKLYPEANDGNS